MMLHGNPLTLPPSVAEFEVVTPGYLDVLSVGKGDLRLEVGTDPKDRTKARELVQEMMRKGYAIFVETTDGLKRVKRFDAKAMVYVVQDDPDAKPRSRKGPRGVPVGGTRATAVGRMAGG